jgi:small-conductance mechanosensitive channel
MVGIVTLGVDLSSLALILGALSVGIGLGLQNLANNVISGVVLLFERPIRVGDRISIGGFEGIVRRINVRATEIETFERALVIMPNSQLLQNAVVNASYADFVGRIEITVKIPFGNDLATVQHVMLAAAEAHQQVARFPAPQVLLHKVIDSGSVTELQVWLRDRTTSNVTRNELGTAIMQGLARAGIVFAPPPSPPAPAPPPVGAAPPATPAIQGETQEAAS